MSSWPDLAGFYTLKERALCLALTCHWVAIGGLYVSRGRDLDPGARPIYSGDEEQQSVVHISNAGKLTVNQDAAEVSFFISNIPTYSYVISLLSHNMQFIFKEPEIPFDRIEYYIYSFQTSMILCRWKVSPSIIADHLSIVTAKWRILTFSYALLYIIWAKSLCSERKHSYVTLKFTQSLPVRWVSVHMSG